MRKPAVLVLEDGSVFRGVSIGAEGESVGEVVFNTAMSGYQEILTDPSYRKQLVTLTYPHIGNTGANDDDEESSRVHAAGLIIRDLPPAGQQLAHEGVPGRVSGPERRGCHRRHRHPPADPYSAREGGAERLRSGRRRAGRGRRAARRPGLSRAQGHGSGQGGQHPQPLRVGAGRMDPGGRHPGGPAPGRRAPAPSRGRLRLRHQAQHPAHAGGARLPGDGGAGAAARLGGPGAGARRRVPVQRPGRSGALRLRDCRHPGAPGHGDAHVRHLSGPSASRPGLRRPHPEDEVRPPWRQPPGGRI